MGAFTTISFDFRACAFRSAVTWEGNTLESAAKASSATAASISAAGTKGSCAGAPRAAPEGGGSPSPLSGDRRGKGVNGELTL